MAEPDGRAGWMMSEHAFFGEPMQQPDALVVNQAAVIKRLEAQIDALTQKAEEQADWIKRVEQARDFWRDKYNRAVVDGKQRLDAKDAQIATLYDALNDISTTNYGNEIPGSQEAWNMRAKALQAIDRVKRGEGQS